MIGAKYFLFAFNRVLYLWIEGAVGPTTITMEFLLAFWRLPVFDNIQTMVANTFIGCNCVDHGLILHPSVVT